ncbi:MAG: 2,3-bisphosphoglycerate-independent phosphoglycerate mutase [Rickettsiales bacterium]|nr:2,3-bisphosphoglycerate-independent phosphoglycerate mutase [Rickettsiales bacterium]
MPARPVVLCILDGWGYSETPQHNAIHIANTPNWDRLWHDNPHALLQTSGLDVGLPAGQMGNSEVGHMNIGGGRIVMQDLPRIDMAIADGSLAEHTALKDMITTLKGNGGVCHLMGLVSDGGVHAHIRHMIALAEMVGQHGVPVQVHAFLDGRDTPQGRAPGFIRTLEDKLAKLPIAHIATMSGRYYAMDRDNRWERVQLAYDAMVHTRGPRVDNAQEAIAYSAAAGRSDEFMEPVVIGHYMGMKDGDGLLVANFRSDRIRQITAALLNPEFNGFDRGTPVQFSHAVSMVAYSDQHQAWMQALFAPEKLTDILGEVVAREGRTQLRIAETEKYAHVTFFFNGGEETQLPGEERILVPSPKVATYDLQPEMASEEVTDKLEAAIDSGRFDLIVVNYANTDMVGHTGVEQAAVQAVEAVDRALGRLEKSVCVQGGVMLITADHGNAELMVDPESGKPHTQHTLNPVPLVMVGREGQLHNGRLCDIAPTILQLMGLPKPPAMTGKSVLTERGN